MSQLNACLDILSPEALNAIFQAVKTNPVKWSKNSTLLGYLPKDQRKLFKGVNLGWRFNLNDERQKIIEGMAKHKKKFPERWL